VLAPLDFATFRLTLLCKAMDRFSLRQFADHGFTYAEWRVLSRLASVPAGATVGQIADLAWVDRAEVSRAAASLEKRGLTVRRENPDDRRTPILHITQAGMDLYQPLLADRYAFHETLMADLTPQEREEFDHILVKVAHRLGSVLKNGLTG
jgi:DNA-binding MarR family transcriptional regulator